jgi:hypothetical protein
VVRHPSDFGWCVRFAVIILLSLVTPPEPSCKVQQLVEHAQQPAHELSIDRQPGSPPLWRLV